MSITGEPDGEPQKVGVALVDVIAGLFADGRHPRRAAPPRRDRRGPAGRGRPAVGAARRARQPGLGLHASPASSRAGWATRHPSIAPYELLRTGDGRARPRGRQRPPVRRALRGRSAPPELAADAALRDQPRPGRAPRRAAGRARAAARRAAAPPSGPQQLTARRRPRRRRQRRRRAPSRSPTALGLEPIVEIPRERRHRRSGLTRNPIRLSETPPRYRSAPPELPGGNR